MIDVDAWIMRTFAPDAQQADLTIERTYRDGRKGLAVLSTAEGPLGEPRFRHVLAWVWDDRKPVLFVRMLNPSTARAFADDQTMKKVFGFAERNGYGAVVVVNECDYRATKPAAAKAAGWPHTGFNRIINERVLNDLDDAEERRDVLCAWGNHGPRLSSWAIGRRRDPRVRLLHLGLTKPGKPEHPCMIGYDRVLTEFVG